MMYESQRLIYRKLEEADYQKYKDWINDPMINQFIEARFTAHTISSLKTYVKNEEVLGSAFFAVIRKDNGHYIGNIKAGNVNKHHLTSEVGLIIGDKNSWGEGYGTESIRWITTFAFKTMGIRKLWAGIYEPNIGSIKAFEKAGYHFEGCWKRHFIYNGEETDCRIYTCFSSSEGNL